MMQRLFRYLQTGALVAGGLLLFFTLMETLRAYQTLRAAHPVLGHGFGLLVLVLLVVLVGAYVRTLARRPRLLRPPVGIDPATAVGSPLRAYARFQIRLVRRLATNPHLPESLRTPLRQQGDRLHESLAAGANAADLARCVRETQETAVAPAIKPLDALAEAEVARSVRDVMLAVTLSPWRTIDLLVVLARNLRMAARVVVIYHARPPLREQALIMRDIFTVVVTVNFLNYGSRLFQSLTSSVPLLGRFTDDLAQGVGAGLLTSVTGHAAIDRCRAYSGWELVAAERSIRANLHRFLGDVKQIVVTDVLQRLRRPVEAQMPEPERPADLQNRLREGVSAALDESAGFLDVLIVQPALATGRGVAGTGLWMGRCAMRGGEAVADLLGAARRRTASTSRSLWAGLRRTLTPHRRPDAAPPKEPRAPTDR